MDALSPTESARMKWAWELVKRAGEKALGGLDPLTIPAPQAAEFVSPSIIGVHVDGMIFVRRETITKTGQLVMTLAHEYGHFATKQHGSRMLSIVEEMFENILDELADPKDDEEPEKKSEDQMPF